MTTKPSHGTVDAMTHNNDFGRTSDAHRAEWSDDSRGRFARQAERLRRGVPIERVVAEYTCLRGTRKKLRGDCPLHEIPQRTLKVYTHTNTFRCSFCGVDGDAIAFLEKVVGLTYGQALEALEHIYYTDDERDAA